MHDEYDPSENALRFYAYITRNALFRNSSMKEWVDYYDLSLKKSDYYLPYGKVENENNTFSGLDWANDFDDFDAGSWESHYNPSLPILVIMLYFFGIFLESVS